MSAIRLRAIPAFFSMAMIGASGCANVGGGIEADSLSPRGLAVGSITFDGGLGAYQVFLAPEAGVSNAKSEYRVSVGSSMWHPFVKLHDDDLKSRGGTFAVDLPAGRYRVNRWNLQWGAQPNFSTAPISISFSIDAGKVTYLGNFHFVSSTRHVTLSDQAERDLPVLRSRYKAVASAPLVSAIAPGTTIEKLGGDMRSVVPIVIPILVPIR